jgi:hypothetical protein
MRANGPPSWEWAGRSPWICLAQAKARLGVLGKGKTGLRTGVPFCPHVGAANKLLRVPTGLQGRNCTNLGKGVFPDGSSEPPQTAPAFGYQLDEKAVGPPFQFSDLNGNCEARKRP